MTHILLLALLQVGAPVLVVGGILITMYYVAKKSVSQWADILLNNHMTHIEQSTGEVSKALQEMAGIQRKSLDLQSTIANTLRDIRVDVVKHHNDQASIVIKLEEIHKKLPTN